MSFPDRNRLYVQQKPTDRRQDVHPELTPATAALSLIVAKIGDDQLGAPTPCREATVADLLDHVGGLCLAFTGAAAKDPEAGRQNGVGRRVAAGPGLADAHT